jgi:hypothetical protein
MDRNQLWEDQDFRDLPASMVYETLTAVPLDAAAAGFLGGSGVAASGLRVAG